MKHEKLLPVLEAGCLGLLLIMLAGSDTRKDSSEPLAFSMLIMGILLIAAIFLILLEACSSRLPKKRMLTLISFKEGHPYHVYEIADEDLFLFCISKFDLNYLIIDKAFREAINQLSEPDKNSRKMAAATPYVFTKRFCGAGFSQLQLSWRKSGGYPAAFRRSRFY